MKKWVHGAVLPAGRPDAKVLAIGTLLHEDSLLNDLLTASGWKGMRFDAEVGQEGEETLWPSRFPKKKLDEIRAQYESQGQLDVYFREYRNMFLDPAKAIFQRKDFIHWTEQEFQDYASRTPIRTFLTVDPAYSRNPGSDYTAFCIASTDPENKLFIRRIIRARMTIAEIVRIWVKLHPVYKFSRHGIQTIDWAKSLQTPLREEMKRQNVFFQVQELPTYSAKQGLYNKEARIEQLAPRYYAHAVIHVGDQPELEQELLSFPRGKHDDCVDAEAMLLTLIWAAPRAVAKKSKYDPSNLIVANTISGY